MIESIKREGTEIVIEINTGLNTKGNILILKWNAENEIFAELLKYQLWNELDKFKKEIVKKVAKYPGLYLEDREISKLKSKLVHEWNSSKHCWK